MLTKATFRLAGYDPALTAAAVTRRLGLQPAGAFEADSPVSRGHPPHARGYSLWLISSSPDIEPDVELGEHLRRLLAILEPVTTSLWELAAAGYEANWYCFAASHVPERAVVFDRQTLTRLLALPGDLWLDVCGDGPGGP